MAKTVVTAEQIAAMPDPAEKTSRTRGEVAPRIPRAQALEQAAQQVWPVYQTLQEMFDLQNSGVENAPGDAEIKAQMVLLGREAGRVRRHVRLVAKALKKTVNADGDEVEASPVQLHNALHRYNLAQPYEPTPAPGATEPDEDEADDEESTEDDTEA